MLHDDPAIKSKIRVYFIGDPNKKRFALAYDYIAREHPDLWIIEANDTYRGGFVGGNQSGGWGDDAFVARHVIGHGALGDFFAGLSFDGRRRATIKMGDTPSLVYCRCKTSEDPSKDSWGGRFVRAWDRKRFGFDHAETNAPTAANKVEVFSIWTSSITRPHLRRRTRGRPSRWTNRIFPALRMTRARGISFFRPRKARPGATRSRACTPRSTVGRVGSPPAG